MSLCHRTLRNLSDHLEEFQAAWGKVSNIVLLGKGTMLHEQESYS